MNFNTIIEQHFIIDENGNIRITKQIRLFDKIYPNISSFPTKKHIVSLRKMRLNKSNNNCL